MARDIPIDSIRLDGDTQVRERIDESVVADYADALHRADTLPPVVVFDDGSNRWLADGFHRVMAHLRLGETDVHADVKQGTRDDAAWFALGANKANGHRLTNADKARAVKRALTMRPNQSNNSIAELVGVSHVTVGKYRDELESISQIDKCSTVTTSDGRQYPARREPSPASETTTEIVDTETGEVLDNAAVVKTKVERPKGEIAPNAAMPVRGHSSPSLRTNLDMPHDPEMAAATIASTFDANFIHALIRALQKHI